MLLNWLVELQNLLSVRRTKSMSRRRRMPHSGVAATISVLEQRLVMTVDVAVIIAELADAANTYYQTIAADQASADAEDQSSFDQYNVAVQLAMNTKYTNDQSADGQFNSAVALISATEASADQAASQTLSNIESTATAAQSASDQSAQDQYNATVSAAAQAQAAADSTSWTTYQSVKDSASATMASTQAAANAASQSSTASAYAALQSAQSAAGSALSNATSSGSESASGGGGGYFELWQDSGFLTAVASAQYTASQAEAAAQATYTSATDSAWTTYESGAQPAQETFDSAIASAQAAYDASAVSAQADEDAAISAAQAAYAASAAAASDAKLQVIMLDLAAAGSAVSAADGVYQSAITAGQTAYTLSYNTANAALQSALANNQATYNSSVAAGQLTLSSSIANTMAAYEAVANSPSASAGDLATALAAYKAAMVGAYQAEITLEAGAAQTVSNNDASAKDGYVKAISAARATQQTNAATAAETRIIAVNSAQQAQLLADSGAENAYQIQLNSFAETQALSVAAAAQTYSLAIDAALATQSVSDASTGNTFAKTMNGLAQLYKLALEDANATYMKAQIDAQTQQQVTIANAAASAWANSAGSGDPYAAYEAAYNAASYIYGAAIAAIGGAAWKTSIDAQAQWAHDVSGGWLTYQNELADHSKTAADITTMAAQVLTDAMAANAYTDAATVFPAIRAGADTESDNAFQAIQSASSAALTTANAKAANALTATAAQISASQSLNDALSDHARHQVNLDTAAGIVLAGVKVASIRQLVSLASPVQAAAFQSPATPMSKEEFDAALRELVEKAGLHASVSRTELYLHDGGNGEIGFDCDDYADVLQRFLNGNFRKDASATVSILTVGWLMLATPQNLLTGRANGHALLVVEQGGEYWFINPTRGIVEGPFAGMDELKVAAKAHLLATYTSIDPQEPITFGGPFADHAGVRGYITSDPQPWYKSPAMRQRFADYLNSQKLDPRPYFPAGVMPPGTNRGATGTW